MSRGADDPRIVRIVAALDRAFASPHTEQHLPQLIASNIIHERSYAEHFLLPDWPAESVRPVLMAYALHAPDDLLEGMAEAADEMHEWVEWWDREGYTEGQQVQEVAS